MAQKKKDRVSTTLVDAKESGFYLRTLKHFRARLAELRAMHGLSYRELHQRSGVNWRQLVSLETGKDVPNPTLATITRLAEALGVEAWEMLTPAQSGVRKKAPKKAKGAG
ncbi:MAG TPA: hypothetical protein DEF51_27840 [Myxococcales bacterium]|nr:hypothetical protein [Myxococcales bacterium]